VTTQEYDRITWRWEPYRSNGGRFRVYEKSPAGFEWCSEGGLYFVFDPTSREEAGRGIYAHARRVWMAVHMRPGHRGRG
jgi:hypothetical protein